MRTIKILAYFLFAMLLPLWLFLRPDSNLEKHPTDKIMDSLIQLLIVKTIKTPQETKITLIDSPKIIHDNTREVKYITNDSALKKCYRENGSLQQIINNDIVEINKLNLDLKTCQENSTSCENKVQELKKNNDELNKIIDNIKTSNKFRKKTFKNQY